MASASSDAAAAAAARDEELRRVEAALQDKDAIMEPGVLDLVQRYISLGGKPAQIIDFLSEEYAGYAQMASLVCQWLRIATPPDPSRQQGGASSSGRCSRAPVEPPVPDEFSFLQELAKERFDAAQSLGMLRRGPPPWLDALEADRRGRQLVYDLSAAHSNSLLLNFALQKIMNKGHEEEVASVGSSLAAYFEVYQHLLCARLRAVATASSTQQLSSISKEVQEASAQSQHTYVHAQLLLSDLGRLPGGDALRRLSQELEVAAVKLHGGSKVWQLQPLFVPPSAPAEQVQAAQLVSQVLQLCAAAHGSSVGSSADVCAADAAAVALGPLLQLRVLYAERLAPLDPIRSPAFMQAMLAAVFAPSRAGQGSLAAAPPGLAGGAGSADEAVAAAMQLLATAVAAVEQRGADGRLTALDRGSVADVAQLLRSASELGQRALRGLKLGPEEVARADEVCAVPSAALGLLHMASSCLAQASTYSEERCSVTLPACLALLRAVARQQPAFINQVLEALHSALSAMGSSRIELAKAVLDLLVQLMTAGAVDATMAAVRTWAAGADPSLVRHFVMQVLNTVAPPYSASFAQGMLSLMLGCSITRVRGAAPQRLAEFASACKDMVIVPPLSQRELHLLDDLDMLALPPGAR